MARKQTRKAAPGRSSIVRCAIYTRKSSEDGLEQTFNSLDAQREACLAYITSQRHEGWRALPTIYDDGGVSGGSLHRPALQQLLADISAARIDLVVVYKVDRLTRSLADFAKLVEVFDANDVSFVSITQHFNTTTSMGRLTLNMLLSFAQFEREVTGERIRDKIAASKRRGMWMGGPLPLGYDVRDRKLVVNETEAQTVAYIFQTYLACGCVLSLQQRLASERVISKHRQMRDGSVRGGTPMGRGALYLMLQNPIYRGQIKHHDQLFLGEHHPIIDAALWEAVQQRLQQHRVERPDRVTSETDLLQGLLFDAAGGRLTPSHAVKSGKRYRYYVSADLITGSRATHPDAKRIPAHKIEHVVRERVAEFLATGPAVLDALQCLEDDAGGLERMVQHAAAVASGWRTASNLNVTAVLRQLLIGVHVHLERIEIRIGSRELLQLLAGPAPITPRTAPAPDPDPILVIVHARLGRAGIERRLLIEDGTSEKKVNETLIRLLARAHALKDRLIRSGALTVTAQASNEQISRSYLTRMARLAFLSPDIGTAILTGNQPPSLTAAQLLRNSAGLPLDWQHQRQALDVD